MSARPLGSPASGGLLDALRALGGTLNEIVRVRGALFAVELREEVERRKHRLLLVAIGATCLHMALVLLTILVAAVFWDTHRIAALGAMAALYLGCGAAAFLRLRAEVAASPAPFAVSMSELGRDFAEFGPLR
jgi:uncharacterized membrane protein YqjE